MIEVKDTLTVECIEEPRGEARGFGGLEGYQRGDTLAAEFVLDEMRKERGLTYPEYYRVYLPGHSPDCEEGDCPHAIDWCYQRVGKLKPYFKEV